jgi:hypothetical protein
MRRIYRPRTKEEKEKMCKALFEQGGMCSAGSISRCQSGFIAWWEREHINDYCARWDDIDGFKRIMMDKKNGDK